MSRCRLALLALALPLVTGADASAQPLPPDSLETARRYARWFLAGHVDSILPSIPPASVDALGGRDGILRTGATIADRAGSEARVVEERFVWRGGRRQYWRTMAMTATSDHFLLRIVIRPDGRFGGYGTGLATNPPPVDSSGPPIRP